MTAVVHNFSIAIIESMQYVVNRLEIQLYSKLSLWFTVDKNDKIIKLDAAFSPNVEISLGYVISSIFQLTK